LALRHQIGILQRSPRKRPKLTPWDRLLWVWVSRIWSDWHSALAIVQPETVVAWHRAAFRLFWTWKVRRGQRERPLISHAVEVKSALSSEADIVRGLFQCVKYRAVLEAQQASEGLPQSARAILVLQAKLPSKLQALKNVLGVELVDEIKIG